MRFLLSRRQVIAGALPALASAAVQSMRLSLSVRVGESFHDKEHVSLTVDQLITLAKTNGYAALCMRASLAGVQTPPAQVKETAAKIAKAGLPVSMVTGDFAVPRNDQHGPDCLRKIGPYLDLAQVFGANLIRVCMKKEEDIAWAARAAQEAAERQIRLAHQSHCASLFETVEGSLQVLRKVNQPNFGLIYEPANWFVAGEDYGPATIDKLKPYIFNAYVQNHRLNAGQSVLETWKKGPVRVDHIGIWDKDGVVFPPIFTELRKIAYQGYVTVHQSFEGVMPLEESVRRSAEYLRVLLG